MDGIHDLAGMQGFGRVDHIADADVGGPFHHDWEAIGYGGIFLGVEKGIFSIDEVRHAVERLEPLYYLMTPYYERYVVGVASLLVEKGVLTQDELVAATRKPFPLARPALSQGRAPRQDRSLFAVGDRVRVRDDHFAGHVRYPAYCRGKVGTVTHRTSAQWPFPDAIGHGRNDCGSEPTLHVEFTGADLWGDDTDASAVVVDLFETYLEPA